LSGLAGRLVVRQKARIFGRFGNPVLEGRTGGEKVFGEVQLDMTSAGPAVLNGFKRP
jgi:hypothetical protein